MKLIYNTNDKPKFGKLIVFALQQVLAIITATIVVPIITNNAAGLVDADAMSPAAALLGAGVGTLVYLLFTKFKSPVFLGSSFAFLGSMAAAFAGATTVALGYAGLIMGAVLAGLVYVIIALIVKFAGTGWLNKLMPAVVIGPTVAIIGLSLAGNAVGDLQKSAYTNATADLNTLVQNYDEAVENKAAVELDIVNLEFKLTVLKAESLVKPSEDLTKEIDNVSATLDAKKLSLVDQKDAETNEILVKGLNTLVAEAEAKLLENFDSVEAAKEHAALLNKQAPINVIICVACGIVTLLVTIVCSTFGKKMVKLIPFICGIGAGYGLGVVLTVIGTVAKVPVLQVIDFSPITSLFTNFSIESIVSIPSLTIVKAFGVFGQNIGGAKGFFSYLLAVAVAYVPVAFVVFAEHIADHKNISSIIEKDLLTEPGLHRTLLGDGVGSMAGALVGGCPNTTYGESVACVAITKNASIATIFTAAIMAIIIAFFTPFVAFVNTIPSYVMGGVCMALYGFIAVSGLKMIQKVDLGLNKNLFVVSTILIAGIGGLALTFGKITITPVACALILGIIINLILNKAKETEEK